MKRVLKFFLLAIFVIFVIWVRMENGILFWVDNKVENKLGFTSNKNLYTYLIRLEKMERPVFLLRINLNDYVSQKLLIYRRLEPTSNSPIILGCNWEKKNFIWNLNFYVDGKYLDQIDERDLSLAINTCFLRLFNSQVDNISQYEQMGLKSIEVMDTINNGLIFKK